MMRVDIGSVIHARVLCSMVSRNITVEVKEKEK